MMLVALAMFGVFFYVSLFMQNILGYSPTKTGATFLPMTILIILIAPFAGKYSDKRRLPLAGGRIGMALVAGSLVVFSRLDQGSEVLGHLSRADHRRNRDGADDDADDRRRDGLGRVDKAGSARRS